MQRRIPVVLTLSLFSSLIVMAVATSCGSSSSGEHAGTPDAGAGGLDGPAQSGPIPDAGGIVGQLDGAPPTALPPLPALTNVVVTERDDSVGIDFDPVDTAVDYRVYPLPSDSDVTANADGSVTVKNAIYRCAGLRQTFDVANNLNSDGGLTPQSADGTGLFTYDGNGYAWKTEIPASPTLGYVYVTPGPGRLPVYALAGYTLSRELGWSESRLKVYTTDDDQRQTLIANRWRDDGIVFYVPSAASASTTTIYGSQTAEPQAGKTYTQYIQYYFTAADMQAHAKDSTPPAPAFQVLSAAATGTQPLMAVFYEPLDEPRGACGGKRTLSACGQPGAGAPLAPGVVRPREADDPRRRGARVRLPLPGPPVSHPPRRAAPPDLLHARRAAEHVAHGRGLRQRRVRRPGLSGAGGGPPRVAHRRRRGPSSARDHDVPEGDRAVLRLGVAAAARPFRLGLVSGIRRRQRLRRGDPAPPGSRHASARPGPSPRRAGGGSRRPSISPSTTSTATA